MSARRGTVREGSEPRRLIINADDLGRFPHVNDAIFGAMDAGLITSATVMANGEAVEDAVARCAAYPACSFGVHMNITWGFPIGPAAPLGALVGADGRFARTAWDLRFTAALRRAVADEWCLQVESLRSRGLAISHLDSHQHVHTIPALFGALRSVKRRTGILRVRLTKNVYCRELPPRSAALRAKKSLWNLALRSVLGSRTTRRFGDLYSVLRSAAEGSLGPGTIEAMVHPGESSDPFMLQEMRELWDGAIARMPFPVRLATYRDL